MKKALFFLALIATFSSQSFAQISETNKAEALKIGRQAIKIMDEGKYDESIELLRQAMKLDSTKYSYPYEIAYAYYQNKQLAKAIDVAEQIITTYDTLGAECYQLLGNMYDDDKKPQKAIETYLVGLKKFPNFGKLYLEIGIVEAFANKNVDKALKYWETGIEKDPKFPSNYYWAAKVYCNSEEEIWGVIYGELFMNIERNSKRTVEISKLLYDTYRKAITINSKKEIGISFSKSTTLQLPEKDKAFKFPFSAAYEMMMSVSVAPILVENKKVKELNILLLNKVKTTFIEQWYSQKKDREYANILFDFQKKLQADGFLEAYNYWIFMKGDEAEFNNWQVKNKDAYEKFATRFDANPLEINREKRFYRTQY
jgi:tetratricopeptide (TPR) repeat protein